MHLVRVTRPGAGRCGLGCARAATQLLLLLRLQGATRLRALRFARFIRTGLQRAATGGRIVLADLRADVILRRTGAAQALAGARADGERLLLLLLLADARVGAGLLRLGLTYQGVCARGEREG